MANRLTEEEFKAKLIECKPFFRWSREKHGIPVTEEELDQRIEIVAKEYGQDLLKNSKSESQKK